MVAKATQSHNDFLNSRKGKVLLGVVSLALAYLMFIRATDTGSWQQYGMLLVLLIFGVNRLFAAIRHEK